MTVKADSKGRLTGARPEARYTRKEHPDGRIEYVPEVPRGFDVVRDVTQEQFKTFFGFSPNDISRDSLHVEWVKSSGKWIPNGVAFEVFQYENGVRIIEGDSIAKARVLIRVEK